MNILYETTFGNAMLNKTFVSCFLLLWCLDLSLCLKKHVTLNLSTILKSVTEQHCYLLMSLMNKWVGCVGGVLMTEETPQYGKMKLI
jgi:hypothetical protein